MSRQTGGSGKGRRKRATYKRIKVSYPAHALKPEDLLHFIELPVFTKRWEQLDLNDDDDLSRLRNRKGWCAMGKEKLNAIERDLIEGLGGFLEDLKAGVKIEKKYTVRRVILDLEPQQYLAGQVKAVRTLLNASQSIFAMFLGVSVKAVRKWESGGKPSDMACRFMDEIRRNPAYWQDRLKESVKVQHGRRNQVASLPSAR